MRSERDSLLDRAVELRTSGRAEDALKVLARLEALHPRFSRLHHERGRCLILLDDAAAAIDALRRAVRLNPTLPESWELLERLHRDRGDDPQAAIAAQNLATLRRLPAEVVVANGLFADGDFAAAETAIRSYLRGDADNVGAERLLARIRMEQGALDEAEDVLAAVVERAPDYHAARLDYALTLLQRQKPAQARRQAELLLQHDPDNRDYLKQYVAACVVLGDHEPVIDIYEKLLADRPQTGAEAADLRQWRANALKIVGRAEEAVADFRASLAARPDNAVAWFGLANLKTYRFAEEEIARMRAAEARNDLQDMDRIYLCFALGKALEDRGEYERSWRFYERGNSVRRAASRWQSDVAEACAERLRQVFTVDFFAARAGWGAQVSAPIFILGLPRSGSTLVEQILASHSAVEGTQELTEIGRYAAEICGRDAQCGLPLDAGAFERLSAADARALGARFLEETRVHRRLGRPFFIDKAPNNFWHVGLIRLILPRATILDVRREPMACCFSNLKQLFGTTNQEFSYDVDEIARYYRIYLRLMRHWADVLPGYVHRVPYEDLVENLDGVVRLLLKSCGLPFEAACLAFNQTKRSVRTPSAEQVRRPIGREGLDHWRHYAPWLGPLEDALGDALTAYRDGP